MNCKEVDFNFNFDIRHNYAWAETLSLPRDTSVLVFHNNVIESLSPGFKGPGVELWTSTTLPFLTKTQDVLKCVNDQRDAQLL